MWNSLKTMWIIFLHMFRRRVTIQYPDEKPYIPPRWRGPHHPEPRSGRGRALRGMLSLRGRLPGGLHRSAGHGRRAWPALSGIFPNQFFTLHFLRIL